MLTPSSLHPRLLVILLTLAAALFNVSSYAGRPNILWISCEDISPHIGCFDDPHAITPNLDALAKEGVRFTNTFTTAGVCAPCRSGIITGMYQTTLGTHHMRCQAKLPKQVRPFPAYLREAGYYCTNNSKQDYQFKTPNDAWDQSNSKAHWRNRPDQLSPFFTVFNFGGCHESGIASTDKYTSVTKDLSFDQRQEPAKLALPPYYPDTPITREDWKRNYELITAMDAWAGDLIQQLKNDGLYENTIIFFWSDHGVGLPRAKRWLYDSGTHVPLIVRVPETLRAIGQGKPGTIDDQLVSSIDFAPTVLNLAGLTIPQVMQGRAFLGTGLTKERDYVYGARDRMDERYDIIRSVRDKRFRYIRNYEPLKPYYQYMNTPEKGATMKEIRRLQQRDALPATAKLFTAATKPEEELYDLQADPHEINNLANEPAHQERLDVMRKAHLQWVADTRDLGLLPESEIVRREAEVGNRYDILRGPKGLKLIERLREVAGWANAGDSHLEDLAAAFKSSDAGVRYWAATGLGNASEAARTFQSVLDKGLKDPEACVRIAAARALCRMGQPNKALPVLASALKGDQQWARLQAAIVLDELDTAAQPLVDDLRACLNDQPNKYITRVANRALNELLGTENQVR